jgi:hypothetical protein
MAKHKRLCGQDENMMRKIRSPWRTEDEYIEKLKEIRAEREDLKAADKEGRKTLERREVDERVLKNFGKENSGTVGRGRWGTGEGDQEETIRWRRCHAPFPFTR